MEKPLLSIVIPSYNAFAHLATLPDRLSTIHERDLPIEVIVVISGVADEDRSRVKEIEARLAPGRVITLNERIHAGPARNLGLEQASGDYIAFLDVDDRYDLQALVDLVTTMRDEDTDAAAGSYRVQSQRNSTKIREYRITTRPTRVLDLAHRHAAVWRYAFRRDWLNERCIRFDEIPIGEDFLYLLEVDVHAPTITVSSRLLYTYIVDQECQASGRRNGADSRRPFLLILASRAADVSILSDVRDLMSEWFVRSWAAGVRSATGTDRIGRICDLRTWCAAGAPGRLLLSAIPKVFGGR